MANSIPNLSGNEHPESGGKGIGGKGAKGKDPHASKTHHKFNKHHGMKHAMGETEPYGDEDTGSGNHEGTYCAYDD